MKYITQERGVNHSAQIVILNSHFDWLGAAAFISITARSISSGVHAIMHCFYSGLPSRVVDLIDTGGTGNLFAGGSPQPDNEQEVRESATQVKGPGCSLCSARRDVERF